MRKITSAWQPIGRPILGFGQLETIVLCNVCYQCLGLSCSVQMFPAVANHVLADYKWPGVSILRRAA